jgi:hypothetical protein
MNATFNPATFLDSTEMSDRAVRGLGHADERTPGVDRTVFKAYNPVPVSMSGLKTAADLRAAAQAFGKRGQTRNAETCLDMAAKLDRFGTFVSDKQSDYAAKLIEWSGVNAPVQAPAAPVAAPVAPAEVLPQLPKLFDLMQRLSKLTIGDITIARKNQDSLCWVKVAGRDGVVGKIENGQLHLWRSRMGAFQASDVLAKLIEIEQDPEAAAVLHGKASGRCAVCSRDLTDPESIERGIGPICAGKF